jgi:hypothetical protein
VEGVEPDRSGTKVYVLDTSDILYDHEAIQKFAEHDVAIPITVLEELDGFKKGGDSKNFAAREFIRFIDGISGVAAPTPFDRRAPERRLASSHTSARGRARGAGGLPACRAERQTAPHLRLNNIGP